MTVLDELLGELWESSGDVNRSLKRVLGPRAMWMAAFGDDENALKAWAEEGAVTSEDANFLIKRAEAAFVELCDLAQTALPVGGSFG